MPSRRYAIYACLLLQILLVWTSTAEAAGGWRSTGPFGASVESISFLGKDGRSLLAITRNAFIYRSDDAGDNWTLIRFPAQQAALAHSLTLHPADTNSFLVGVSSPNAALAGLYQTQDGGQTWKHVLKGIAVFSAAYAPSNPSIVAAGARDGVYLSGDNANSWGRISPIQNKELQPVMSLGFDPKNPAVLYAGTPHLPWKTSNSGGSWTSIHHGMIDDSDILALIVNQAKPEQLFIGACSGIYRSDNSATRWTKLLGITGAGFRTYSVTLDPQQSDVVYSGTRDGLWRSKDLGKSWQKLAPNIIKATAVSPIDSKLILLATEDAGILRSRDGGETFDDASNGVVDRRIVRMTIPGRNVFLTYGHDASTVRASLDDLVNPESPAIRWKRVSLPPPLVTSTLDIATAGSNLYAFGSSGSSGIHRSTDNGLTWKPLPPVPGNTAGVGVSKVPLTATSKTIYRLDDNALAWTPASSLGLAAGGIQRLLTTRSGIGPAWVETGNGSVLMSADGGKSWSTATLPARAADIYQLDATSTAIWAATGRGLFRSSDNGRTWKLCDKGIDGGSTTVAVAVRQENPQEAFAAQFGRIFRTADGGESWREFPVEGLQGASIASLAIASGSSSSGNSNNTASRLVALTSARGIFVHDLNPPESAGAPAPATAAAAATSGNRF